MNDSYGSLNQNATQNSATGWQTVDADTAISALHDIKVETTAGGRRAPYQYLVLLWAISAELRGVIQPQPYLAVRNEIAPLLDRFALTSSRPNPANPWFALKQSPWWSIPNPVNRYKEVSPANMLAGLSQQIRTLIASDTTFAGRAVAEIRFILSDMVENTRKVDDTIEELGLGQLRLFKLIPVESNTAETFKVNAPELSEEERTREETCLQNAYKEHLEAQGHEVYSIDIPVDGVHLRADLYDATEDELIEVKSSIDRNTIRLGLGQILDYARIVQPRRKILLLPALPSRSLVWLLGAHDVRVLYRTTDGLFEEAQL